MSITVVRLYAAATLVAGLPPGGLSAGDPVATHAVVLAGADVTVLVAGSARDLAAFAADVCHELRMASPATACPCRAPLRAALGRLTAADAAVPVEALRALLDRADLA